MPQTTPDQTTPEPGTSQDSLGRIRALLDQLIQLAPWWQGFCQVLGEEDIASFETAHRIALPEGYRSLLRQIGDRAPIPGQARGGLLPLADALTATTASDYLGALAEPFPFAGVSDATLPWDDARDDYRDPPPLRGLLPIGDGGCDVTYHLVVSGAERGQVWVFAPSGAPELSATGESLLAWYERRLVAALTPLQNTVAAREALEERVERDPQDLAAAVELGRELLLTDTARAASLIEQAWQGRAPQDDEARVRRLRAVAELDLLQGRDDRIEGMRGEADAWLQCFVAVAAARAHRWGDFASHIAAAHYIPMPWRALVAAYRAQAKRAEGDKGEAMRANANLRAGREHHPQWQPHRPTLADRLLAMVPPLPDDAL